MKAHVAPRHVIPVLTILFALVVSGLWIVRMEAAESAVPDVPDLPRVPESDFLPGDSGDSEPVAPDPEADDTSGSESAEASPQPGSREAYEAARQVEGQPETFHWAVIIGPDDYQGSTGSTLGSAADARQLTDILTARGWRGDHVWTLTNAEATAANIRAAFDWLARKTDGRSTAVVSFSGHMDHRGSGPGTAAALWTHDNQRIWPEEFGPMMGAINAGRMWISLQGCHAAGLAAPGVEGPGRVVTYSSHAAEKSYEDPEAGHSVMGNYLFREGLAQGWGNGGDPEGVSVQGAFDWAAPRANTRTSGLQTPVMADGVGGPFTLEIAPVPAAR